jgi:hypothetical protein
MTASIMLPFYLRFVTNLMLVQYNRSALLRILMMRGPVFLGLKSRSGLI